MTTAVLERPETSPPAGSDYAGLSRRIKQAGLLDRRPGYYAVRIGLVALAYAGGWVALAAAGASWWGVVLVGALFAVVYAQVALVAHDLAHKQVFRGRRAAHGAGLIAGNLGIGMSYGWWMNKHTRHHAHPNHEEDDPDLAPDILVWSRRQASQSRGVPAFIGRYQAFLFFPLLLLEGFNLRYASGRALARGQVGSGRTREAVLFAAHVGLYLAAVFTLLSPLPAVVFILVHQCLFGLYLGSTFAPNHKGMPTLTGDDRPDYLRRQVLTARNIGGGVWLDVLYGGLNYQIEHHLFPSMPTANLRRAQPIVRQYCAEIGVPYLSTGVVESYAQALRHLHSVGAPLRSR